VTRSMMRLRLRLACGVWSKRRYNGIDVEESTYRRGGSMDGEGFCLTMSCRV
jgi:hypothetical protein